MPLYRITYRQPGSRALWRALVETADPQVVRERIAGLDLVSIDPPLPGETPLRVTRECAPAARRPASGRSRQRQGRGDRVTSLTSSPSGGGEARPTAGSAAPRLSRPVAPVVNDDDADRGPDLDPEPPVAGRRPAGGRMADDARWRRLVSHYLAGTIRDGQIIAKSDLGALLGYARCHIWDPEQIQLDLALHRAPFRHCDRTRTRTCAVHGRGYIAETHYRVRAA